MCHNIRVATPELKSVYFIFSQHKLLLREALARLAEMIGSEGSEILDVVSLQARDDGVDRALAECQTLSFLGGRRLVVVDGPLSFPADAQKRLAAYIENPNPQTVLVLAQETDGSQMKRRLASNKLLKLCRASEAADVAEYEVRSGVASWIKAAFAGRGKQVEPAAVKYLQRWVGTDLDNLSTEVAKVADAAGDNKVVDVALCRQVVVTHGEAEVYDFIGAVVERDKQKALVLLEPLLERESEVGNTFALLERQFQLILRTKIEQLKGESLARRLGVSKGQAYFLEKQSRLFSPPALKKALGILLEADYYRKSRPVPPRILLEQLTVDLCGLGR